MESRLKIVTIGGGNGQSCTLRALKYFLPPVEITAVVSVSDSGGSSGRLREKFNILPVGDLLRAMMALSSFDYLILREIFYSQRFRGGELDGHSAGNLLLTFLYQQSGNWLTAIKAFSQILKLQGRVLPVTLDLTHLCGELENGQIIKGEARLEQPEFDCHLRKKRMWLEPAGQLLPAVQEAVSQADFIILGPGDLYTSIIPGLLVQGMSETLGQSKTPLIFIINNANRQAGETCSFKVSDYVREIHKYLPRPIDYLVVQDKSVRPNLEHFALKKWEPVEVDEGEWQTKYQVIYQDLYAKNEAGIDWQQLVEPLGKVLELRLIKG